VSLGSFRKDNAKSGESGASHYRAETAQVAAYDAFLFVFSIRRLVRCVSTMVLLVRRDWPFLQGYGQFESSHEARKQERTFDKGRFEEARASTGKNFR